MGLGSRSTRAHDTEALRRVGTNAEAYHDFAPGQRVMTVDGIPGVVTAVLDGPVPGWEAYQVSLDNGVGGGDYTTSQLRAMSPVTSSHEHDASADYPELGSILLDRPDIAHPQVLGSRPAGT